MTRLERFSDINKIFNKFLNLYYCFLLFFNILNVIMYAF